MEICQQAFEAWYGMTVGEDMDITTSIAWDGWCAAWRAAHAVMQDDKKRDLAYERTCSMWLTAATSDREKFAYRDGHDRGWRNAAEALRIATRPPHEHTREVA